MSKVGPEGRSFAPITIDDLKRLSEIASQDRKGFFRAHPQWAKLYERRVICVALCQGAALHYIDGTTGVNDFDVYTFYEKNPLKDLYAKRIKSYDFGNPKFGKSLGKLNFTGRRVDCLFRSVNKYPKENAKNAIWRYLEEGKTETARLLSAKAVVFLELDCGKIIWPR
jgi:hypothetical protein